MSTEACNGCYTNRIRATSYQVTSTAFNIVDSFTEANPRNGRRYELILCANLPSLNWILPVFVTFNGTLIPVLDNIGNHLMSDQIRTRKCYPLVYGTNPVHMTVTTCVPTSAYNPPAPPCEAEQEQVSAVAEPVSKK